MEWQSEKLIAAFFVLLVCCVSMSEAGILGEVRKEVRSAAKSKPSQPEPSKPKREKPKKKERKNNVNVGGVLNAIRDVVRDDNSSVAVKPKRNNSRSNRNPPKPPRPARSPRRPQVNLFASTGGGWFEPDCYEPPIFTQACNDHVVTETVIYETQPPVYAPVPMPADPIVVQPPIQQVSHCEPAEVGTTLNGQLEFHYGNDFNDLNMLGGNFVLQAPQSLGIDIGWELFREDAGDRDRMLLGDVNLTYQLINDMSFQLRAGLGVNWLSDSYGGEAGINFLLASEFVLTGPLVANTELNFGKLGDADFFHGRGSLGLRFDKIELFAGYQYYDIGGVEIDGILAGIRVRF